MKRILLLILSVIVSATCFIACGKKNKDENPDAFEPNTELIFGFDGYEQVQSFKIWGDRFGRAEVNTDADFVTQGEASLHVMPEGNYESINGYPYFLMDAASDFFATNDFSKYTGIVMDVYNDSDESASITVRLGVAGRSGTTEDTASANYVLSPKRWTKVLYDFSDGSMKYNFKNLESVSEIYVQFNEYRHAKDDPVKSLYFDNLCGVKGASDEYSKTVSDGILLDFEDARDINLIDYRTYTFSRSFDPIVSVSTDSNFATSGRNSLKCLVEYKENTHIFINSPNPYRVMTVYNETFGNAFEGKTKLSFDITNANPFDTRVSYFYDFNSSDVISYIAMKPYESRTVTMEVGDFTKSTKFGLRFCPVLRENEVYYLDNFRAE